MERRKSKNSLLYPVILVLLLCAAFLAVSVTPAFARFRSEIIKGIVFEVREPERFCLGKTVEGKFSAFSEGETPEWKVSDGKATLELAVANGTGVEDYAFADQKVGIRIIGGPDLSGKEVKLVLPEKDSEGNDIEIIASEEKIAENSELYFSFGDGFVFTFELSGTEYSRVLKGEKLSHTTFCVVVDVSEIEGEIPVSQQIFAEIIN